jgi:GntR family transcriptional regulator
MKEMINVCINRKTEIPKYKQIIEQIKLCLASCQIKPGERMPTVRELSQTLKIHPATVDRAYQKLKEEGILEANHSRGTVVLKSLDNDQRTRRLMATIDVLLLDTLSRGYDPDELERHFNLRLASWKIQRDTQKAD